MFSYRKAFFEDCDMLYEWAMDPATRENAHNKGAIEYEDHVRWFREKLESPESRMFIVLSDDEAAALLRLDMRDGGALLSYTVAPERRGRGVGGKAVSMLPGIISGENIICERIVAEVYKTNTASNKIFLSAGYIMSENGGLNIFTKALQSGGCPP